jgi:hypothetical protein
MFEQGNLERETSVGRTQNHVWSGVLLLLMADLGTAQAEFL